MKKVICIANQKGGVGKTTTTVNLGASLAVADQNVLLIDIDPQGNASTGLGLNKSDGENTIYTALIEGVIKPEMINDTAVDRLKAIPSTTDLYGAEIELVTIESRERRLSALIEQVSDQFDFVLIDCPPSLGMLTLNALTAADSILIPIQTEFYALEGLTQLSRTLEMVRSAYNPDLAIEGIVFTMVDGRTTLSHQVMDEVRKYYGEQVFKTIIPRNVRLSEAPSHGKPIILYDPRSKGADAYIDLAHEMIANHKKNGKEPSNEAEIKEEKNEAISNYINELYSVTEGDDS